jgi:hypothetical protein
MQFGKSFKLPFSTIDIWLFAGVIPRDFNVLSLYILPFRIYHTEMRLLKPSTDGSISLTRFAVNEIPNYAILSHSSGYLRVSARAWAVKLLHIEPALRLRQPPGGSLLGHRNSNPQPLIRRGSFLHRS